MKISAAFPSNYLKAADLQDRAVRVVMERVAMEDIGSDHKPVLYFEGKEKGLVLNKTNANNIAAAYGDDTNDWAGREIELFPTIVDFQGRSVDAIRVRAPRQSAAAPARPASPAAAGRDPMDDNIPFAPEAR